MPLQQKCLCIDPVCLYLGCRKWGCNKWGFKGCLAALPGNRPKSAFFALFRPFPEGLKSTWKIQKTEEKGLFPRIPSDFLKPPSLKPPFAAPQYTALWQIRPVKVHRQTPVLFLRAGEFCLDSLKGFHSKPTPVSFARFSSPPFFPTPPWRSLKRGGFRSAAPSSPQKRDGQLKF